MWDEWLCGYRLRGRCSDTWVSVSGGGSSSGFMKGGTRIQVFPVEPRFGAEELEAREDLL